MSDGGLPPGILVDRALDGGPGSGTVHAAGRMLEHALRLASTRAAEGTRSRATFRDADSMLVVARDRSTGSVKMNVRAGRYEFLRLHDRALAHPDGDLRDRAAAARIVATWIKAMRAPEEREEDISRQIAARARCEARVLRWWRATATARNRPGSRRVTFGWGTPRNPNVDVTGYDQGNGPLDKSPNEEMALHPALAGAPVCIRFHGTLNKMVLAQSVTSHDDVGAIDVIAAMRDLGDPEIANPNAFTIP